MTDQVVNERPMVAAQLYVFQQVYGQKGIDFVEHVEEALADVAAAGIEGVETGFTFAETRESAERLKQLLDRHSLKLCGFHGAAGGGVFHVEEEAEEAMAATLKQAEIAKGIGCTALYVNPAPKPAHAEKTAEELAIQVKYLEQLGEGLQGLGVSLGLHNHTPAALSNAREIRYNCEHTPSQYVSLCLDTHWVLRGGADPIALLNELGDRVIALHIRNSREGVWTEDFGEGDIDHGQIADWVSRTQFTGPLIIELAYEKETKITRSLRENLTASRQYVRQVFGV